MKTSARWFLLSIYSIWNQMKTTLLAKTILLVLFPTLLFAQTDDPPGPSVLVQPPHESTNNPTGVALQVLVSDPDPDLLSVTFYGRKKPGPEDDFTVIDLPDTQYYTGEVNGGSAEIFYTQTDWIINNMFSEKIAYVIQPGDCVENGDAVEDEWKRADTAMLTIEDPVTTQLIDGIPYAIAVGNHDQSPFGDPDGTTDLFNAYFGSARFAGRAYYGGHYGANNDNSFQFFSAGGMDFIVIALEFDPSANQDVLNWADSLLIANSHRRAIIVSHYIIKTGNPANFGPQGQAIYNQFKDNPNVFLMLGAHVPGEGQRTDIFNGDTIHSLLADYQMRDNGGNGWLRILRFSPQNNTISVKTYSPWLDLWETDADSEFELQYNMNDAGFEVIGTVNDVMPGSTIEMPWPDLDPGTEYQWYVSVNDGSNLTTSQRWSFTTGDHKLDFKVYLQGAFNGINMDNNPAAIPLSQPFNPAPWNYDGLEMVSTIPEDVVDWILVELRDTSSALAAGSDTRVWRKAAFLKTNGDIVASDGSGLLTFPEAVNQKLFALIWHRNHLPVMTANPLINSAGVFQYDFTKNAEAVFAGESGTVNLGGEIWGMAAGDNNSDGIINAEDYIQWKTNAGNAGYLQNDHNMDLQSNNNDKNDYWLINVGKDAMIPN